MSVSPDPHLAVADLFDAHALALRAYLIGRVGVIAADDLVSDTFVAAFRRWHTFDPSRGSARAWLFGVATNELRHHWRSDSRHLAAARSVPADPDLTPDDTDQLIDRIDAANIARQLLPALTGLHPIDLDILLLNAWADLTSVEIAAALGLPAATVRTKLRRTRHRLREAAARPTCQPSHTAMGEQPR